MLNRRCEENGLFEMCSPYNEELRGPGGQERGEGRIQGNGKEAKAKAE